MRINFLKKVVVGGLITSLCLCCCFLNFNKNVNASKINEDSYNYLTDEFISMFNFENYGNIENLNDLKGTMWLCNYDVSYPTLSNDFDTYTLNYISPYDVVEENNYLLAPFILQNPNYFVSTLGLNYIYELKCYSLLNNGSIEFVENFANSDFLKNFISSNLISTTFSSEQEKFIYDSNSFRVDELIIASNNDFEVMFSSSQYDITFSYFMKNANESDSQYYSALMISPMSSPFILCFPNSNYTLEYSTSNELVNESDYLEMFKTHFTQIEFENFSIRKMRILKDLEFDKGYNDGYNDGYNQGVYDATDTSYRFPFLTGILNAVSDVLALEIFPNIRLGYFVLIPLVLGITGMIFWFWRKD